MYLHTGPRRFSAWPSSAQRWLFASALEREKWNVGPGCMRRASQHTPMLKDVRRLHDAGRMHKRCTLGARSMHTQCTLSARLENIVFGHNRAHEGPCVRDTNALVILMMWRPCPSHDRICPNTFSRHALRVHRACTKCALNTHQHYF